MKKRLFTLLCCALAVSVKAQDKPNIVWITSEDNGAHWLGCYGNPLVQTPNLDELASKGIQFNAAYSNAPVCAVARSTTLMGRYATSLGTQNMRSRYPVPKSLKSYPQLMKEAGYYTINKGKTDYNMEGSDQSHWDICKRDTGWKDLAKSGEKPFFLVMNHTISHESSLFEKKIKSNRKSGAIPQVPTIPLEKVPLPPHLPDTKEMRSDWVIYADVMQALDKRIGKDIKQILESEHADNTIIFYFSDHGGILPRAKRYIFNTGTQVPFMVYLPKKWEYLSKFKPGSKTDDVVSFVDLASTVLNIAGAKIPDSMHGQPFLGENVSPKKYAYLFSQRFDEQIFKFSRGLTDGKVRYTKNFHPHRDRAIHGGFAHGQAGWLSYFNLYKKNKLNNITGLIWQPTQPKEELFDVTKDPWEVNNLITPENRPVKADDLSKALFSKMLETRDTGIVPEMMYGEISKSSTIYDYVNAEEFPYEEALSLAWQAVSSKDLHLALLKSSQPVIRYWAVMQCSIDKARGAELVDALLEMKGEQTPAVKIALVEALHHLGKTKDANTILLETLKASTDDIVRIEGLKLATITGVADEWDNETWNSFCKGSGYASRRKRK